MHHSFSSKFNMPWIILHPGDYYSDPGDVVISTILGSCIAVVLHDPALPISGMNHFMLPSLKDTTRYYEEDSGRYGTYAMDLLINSLMRQGASRSRLTAKVFGGGHVLSRATGKTSDTFSGKGLGNPSFDFAYSSKTVPESNIHFALEYLKTEGIPLHGHDLGGYHGRKIYLFSRTGKVLLSKLTGSTTINTVAAEEKAYLRKVAQEIKKKDPDEGITLF